VASKNSVWSNPTISPRAPADFGQMLVHGLNVHFRQILGILDMKDRYYLMLWIGIERADMLVWPENTKFP
jgi:hypothetical protein